MKARLTLLSLLLCACGASSARSLDLRTQGVRLADLPYGATPEPGHLLTATQAARRDGVVSSVYARQGRLTTYVTSYSRPLVDGTVPMGPIRVDSETAAYRTVSGARAGIQILVRRLRHGYAMGTPAGGANVSGKAPPGAGIATYRYVPQRVPRIGQEDTGFTTYFPGDEFSYRMWLIVFRQDRYVVTVRAVGIESWIPLSTAVHLVQKVDTRLKKAITTTT